MSYPAVGSSAPLFTLRDGEGNTHSLEQYRGKWVLLYFYPKDDTPGCTKQACDIRDEHTSFEALGVVVLGVSVDSEESHAAFSQKFHLNFPLLSDTEKTVVEAYGVWQDKTMMVNAYKGTVRTSFLISPEGTIAAVYEQVKPETHTAMVLEDIRKAQAV
jgi:peroxiredoxin Q/BCP